MMRRKVLEGLFYGSFDVRRVLTDLVRTRILRHTHRLEPIQAVEDRCVCAERNVEGVIRMARIVCLLNPLEGGFNLGRQNALRYI